MRCRPYSGPVSLVRLDTGERGERRDHMWRAGPVWVWEENIALYFLFSVLAPELSLSLLAVQPAGRVGSACRDSRARPVSSQQCSV